MARDPGSTLRTAQAISISDRPKFFRNTVNTRDRLDTYRFTVGQRSRLDLTLTGLRNNVDVSLLNNLGKVLKRSTKRGRSNEAIQTQLEAGTYFIQVISRQGSTPFSLRLAATDPNPVVVTNQGVTLNRGAIATLTSSLLQTRATQSSNPLYTLTELPQAGRLLLNGVPLGLNGTFTQADIDNNRITYQSVGLTQLTNTIADESTTFVRMSGLNVAWSSFDGNDEEIFFYNGLTGVTTQVTNNDTVDNIGQLSGSTLTWTGFVSSTQQDLFAFDGASGRTTQITNDPFGNFSVGISDNYIVWNGSDGSDEEIFVYNRATGATTPITNNSLDDTAIPNGLSGSYVAYYRLDGNDFDAFVYNIATNTTTQITNNGALLDESPDGISGTNIAIAGFDSTSGEPVGNIFLYDISTNRLTPITANPRDDYRSQISGNNLIWLGNDGTDYELYFRNGTTGVTTPLTNNNTDERWIGGISGTNVFWSSFDGSDQELFFFNGVTTTQLTNNSTSEYAAAIAGSSIVWEGTDGSSQELFFNNLAASDRFSFNVADGLGNSTNGSFNISIG